MRKKKQSQSLRNLGAALERLREALQEPETNSLVVDGTIQRFEFVIELFWKTLKRLVAAEGIQTGTPREAIQRATKNQTAKTRRAQRRPPGNKRTQSLNRDKKTRKTFIFGSWKMLGLQMLKDRNE